ncbi:ADP-ribosylglycohydrolase family protein [Brevibacillus fluminis]|uniref:ADP-ribosylglycohydrolase family protein n=2 Tax=Brevibacillus fluminis TaxID=511487 RepID=A0A3M8D563_9BACL|nr:ADP-ribosylglycohydrolase family protein [Brevibacillus fluminis]
MTQMTLDRVKGALVGVAIGDAMGMPSELWSRQKVKARFGKITEFLPGPDDHFVVKGFAAGQFTDDTAQTLKICQSIIQRGGEVNPTAVAHAILEWADEVNAFTTNALGPSSQKALLAIKSGVPVEQAGGSGDTNGAAMRISPIGLICKPDNIIRLVDEVEKVCLGTHNTNIAIAGAALLAAAISAAIETRDWDSILSVAFAAYDEGMKRGNDTFGASSKERVKWALELIASEQDEERLMDKLYNLIGAGVATTEAVPMAIALSYYAKGDLIKGVLLAANLGGDCDTVGAMVGGLCGAYTGFSAIPAEHVQRIADVNGVHLPAIAEQLFAYRK